MVTHVPRSPRPVMVAGSVLWAVALAVTAAVVIAEKVVDHVLGGHQ